MSQLLLPFGDDFYKQYNQDRDVQIGAELSLLITELNDLLDKNKEKSNEVSSQST